MKINEAYKLCKEGKLSFECDIPFNDSEIDQKALQEWIKLFKYLECKNKKGEEYGAQPPIEGTGTDKS